MVRLRKPRAEPRRCSRRPLMASVGPVGGAGTVEVGQDVGGALLEGPPERDDLFQHVGNAVADALDELPHELTTPGLVGFAVGGDHALVDVPGGLDLDVFIGGEQGFEPLALLVGEEVGSSVQGPASGEQRVAFGRGARRCFAGCGGGTCRGRRRRGVRRGRGPSPRRRRAVPRPRRS